MLRSTPERSSRSSKTLWPRAWYWPLRLAMLFSIALVWLAGTNAGPRSTELPVFLLLHVGAALFAAMFFINRWISSEGWRQGLIGLQCLATVMVVPTTLLAPCWLAIVCAQNHRAVRRPVVIALLLLTNAATLWVMLTIYALPLSSAFPIWALFVCFQGFSFSVVAYADKAARARLQLAEVNAELMATRSLLMESTRSDERSRISRELHDMTGHTITALRMNLRRLADLESEHRNLAKECLGLTDELLAGIRNVVTDLRQGDAVDLHLALQQLAAPFEQPQFSFELAAAAKAPEMETARLVIGVAREAITNVVRHAAARECRIALSDHDQRLLLLVEDDGRGMGGAQAGDGMQGMMERVKAVGGDISWSPSALGGVCLRASIPVYR